MSDITSANAVVTITIPGVFSVPQQLQGFDVDGVVDNDAVDVAETKIGVDGKKSSGFIYNLVPTTIHLQADSASITLFETWLAAMKTNQQDFPASMGISLPAVGRKYALTNGTLKRPKQMPDVHRVLQARSFVIDWEDISPANQ